MASASDSAFDRHCVLSKGFCLLPFFLPSFLPYLLTYLLTGDVTCFLLRPTVFQDILFSFTNAVDTTRSLLFIRNAKMAFLR